MRIRTHTNPLSYKQRFEKLSTYADPQAYEALDFEIGFGQERFMLDYAQQHPQRLVVGAEVRKKAVELMQEKITQRNIPNVIALHGNGHICLEDLFEDATLDALFIFHPDPWMKRRHYNRRVVTLQMLKVAAAKLKPAGRLYISTDVADLWEYINELIAASGCFDAAQDDGFWRDFYSTRWSDIAQEKQRTVLFGTFSPRAA